MQITPNISQGRMRTILTLLLAKRFRIYSALALLSNHRALLVMQGFTLSSSSTALIIALTPTQHSYPSYTWQDKKTRSKKMERRP